MGKEYRLLILALRLIVGGGVAVLPDAGADFVAGAQGTFKGVEQLAQMGDDLLGVLSALFGNGPRLRLVRPPYRGFFPFMANFHRLEFSVADC